MLQQYKGTDLEFETAYGVPKKSVQALDQKAMSKIG